MKETNEKGRQKFDSSHRVKELREENANNN